MARNATPERESDRRPDAISEVLAQWSRARLGLDLGPLGAFVAVAHVYWLTTPRIERLMAEYGIKRGLFDVLTVLRRTGGAEALPPRQIARSLLLSSAGLTSRLDRLEAEGFVIRGPDPHDGRGLLVRLTPNGRRLVDRILPRLIRLEAGLASALSRKQVAQLTHLLDLWAASMQPAGRSSAVAAPKRGLTRSSRMQGRRP
jgi:DNA-binding MarR family transcriptional regulator